MSVEEKETVIKQLLENIESLKKQVSFYQEVFDIFPAMYLSVDPLTKEIIDCNKKFVEEIGYQKNEIIGKSIFDIYSDSFLPEIKEALNNETQIRNREFEIKRKTGSVINVCLSSYSIFDNEESLQKIILSLTNISKDNKNENEIECNKKKLLLAEERYRLLAEATEHGIWDWNLVTNEIYFSPQWKRQIGYEDYEIENKFESWIDHLHPDEKNEMLQKVDVFLNNGKNTFEIDFRFRHKDGSYKYIHNNAIAIKSENGKTIRMFGTHTDFTKLKTAQIELETQWKQFESILNAFPEIMYVIDPKTYEVVFVNKHFQDILGKNPVGKKCYDAFQGFEFPCTFCTNELIDKSDDWNNTWEYRNKLLKKNFQVTDKIIKWTDGRELKLEIAIDITNQKNTEEELLNSLNAIKKSNHELEQFAYVISHDLQEPLRMVHSFTQLLEKKYYDKIDETGKQYIYYASDGAARMQQLINDLLQVSRISKNDVDYELVSLSEVVNYAIDNLKIKIEENGAIITADSLPEVMANKNQICRVFQNIIENSLKYRSNINPIISITFKQIEIDKIRITIEDNGIGFDNKYKDKVFTIFQRLHSKDEYSGTGIGLSICKKIIERHGGEIWADSKEGFGTKIHFTIKIDEG